MILKIGSYSFETRKTWLTWRRTPVMSKRRFRMYDSIVATFGGTVTGADLTTLESAIDAAQTAAQLVNEDFKLFQADGVTPTKHVLETASTLYGTRFEFEWVKGQTRGFRGNGTEYVNKRSFIGRMLAEVEDNEEEIVEWNERVYQVGSGGAELTVKESIAGAPIEQLLQAETGMVIVQEGYGVGWSDWPDFPTSILGGAGFRAKPAYYERSSPIIEGRYASRLHPIKWRYTHEITTAPGSPVLPTAAP